jgi:hypothetical protein
LDLSRNGTVIALYLFEECCRNPTGQASNRNRPDMGSHEMNDTVFIFVVLPLTICFVGFVFSLIFGPDVLRWHNEQLAMQRKTRAQSQPAPLVEKHEDPYRFEPVPSKREKELAHS